MNSVELILAGYVLVVPTPRPPSQEYAVLPETFLTISDCLMADLPRPEFWDWYVDRQEAERERISRAPHAETVTVAIASDDAVSFMQENGGAEQPYFDLLRTESRLPVESPILGYEVVGAEGALDFHSWHCHGYAAEAFDELRVQLNELGLIGTYQEAARVLAWMLGQPPENQPAPVDWMVVAIAK
ncbi:hypothetical protein E1263_26095 [Kribbella antibiotica]|uniref:Uncharacterized protein n=1 Tax=Kribbella antibiotica TaxID=190195 RepID=A0A4R4ZB13_9ACTN|nr:hypothetical protein [Kribbella antibiotica]TDD55425.1 hypothetical protein E1263_26095 [Kribbella antibiotica]